MKSRASRDDVASVPVTTCRAVGGICSEGTEMLLRALIIIVVALVGLLLVVVGIGALLPKRHVISRSVKLRRAPQEVWAVVSDVDQFTGWRPGVNGRKRWKEEASQGAITFELVEAAPPSRMVTRIADPSLPFGGSWTYLI